MKFTGKHILLMMIFLSSHLLGHNTLLESYITDINTTAQSVKDENNDLADKLHTQAKTLENISTFTNLVIQPQDNTHQMDFLNNKFITLVNTKIRPASLFGIVKLADILSNTNIVNRQLTMQTQTLTAFFKNNMKASAILYTQLQNLQNMTQLIFNGNTLNELRDASYTPEQPNAKLRFLALMCLLAANTFTITGITPWAASFFSGATWISWVSQKAIYTALPPIISSKIQNIYNKCIPPQKRLQYHAQSSMRTFVSELKALTDELQKTLSPLAVFNESIAFLCIALELPQDIKPNRDGIELLMRALDTIGYLDICITLAICSDLGTICPVSFADQEKNDNTSSIISTFNTLSQHVFPGEQPIAVTQSENEITLEFKTLDSKATDFMNNLVLSQTLGIICKTETTQNTDAITIYNNIDLSRIIIKTNNFYSPLGKQEYIQSIIYSLN